jgi:PPE-repeat protein
MWAQDATAMYGYAGSAAAATQLTPFSPPQQNTNSGGLAGQANAVSQAGELPAGVTQSAVSTASQSVSSVPGALSGVSSSLGLSSPEDLLNLGADAIAYGIDAPLSPLGAVSFPVDLIGAQTGVHTDDIVSDWDSAGVSPQIVMQTTPSAAPATTANVVTRAVSAEMGEANTVGSLSVPPTWAAATPVVRPIALALPAAPAAVAPQAMAPSLGSSFGEMALAGTAGRAIRDGFGARGREQRGADQGRLRAVSAAAPKVGEDDTTAEGEARTVVTGIAAEIRDMARLRDEGLISDEEYTEQRNRLLGR